ncbi:hypothetical protein K493DRAFT_366001 [Basidiobolus meristosporus CBS 931.73]|uniref:Ecp2 effector protein domain-containing protein n=1 Tax=Basidiobolus meristosporus CBS 931.73 TaxID=1314790 RepID=A0A1Y1YM81_9FUNG|nr:hypothetical protein K493DRAFT_366001 [Basidiobolus meristosporus CBS 931.73]|eukprot:ORX99119.1 hypothetical protein K493DRAFT_366001 [Basidiobolus meristosporus CBS 931.73]
MHFLIPTLVCVAVLSSVSGLPSSPKENPFTPENYPGLIIKEYGTTAICYHGDIVVLAKTSSECLADVGCYTLDRDRKQIKSVLDDLQKNGNEVWPMSPWGSDFPHRVDPKGTDLKDWPGKGEQATCTHDPSV